MFDALKEFLTVARRHPKTAIFGVLLLVGLTTAGGIYSDYREFTKSRRDELAKFYGAFLANREELDPVIMAFVAKAKTGQDVPAEKRDELTLKLVKVRNRAEQVAAALPEARTETASLVDAMTVFSREALMLKGPADARPFWEALGKLDDAERALTNKVTSIQNSYAKRATS